MASSSDLIALRVSVARIAQALGVDNALRIQGDAYEALVAKATRRDRGWNELAGLCVEKVERQGLEK